MVPSEDDIAKFIAFAPSADEGKAFMFLEVRPPHSFGGPEYQPYLMCVLKGAETIDEAVGQFYENPDKYSDIPVPSKSNPANQSKESKTQAYSPPPYAPPVNSVSGSRRRPHTNAVIEAGNIRARDEVRLTPTSAW
jgi:hypothetical protein